MWNRSQLKRNAKSALKRNYWKCVLAAILLTIALGMGAGAGSAARSSTSDESHTEEYYENEYNEEVYGDELASESSEDIMSILNHSLPPAAVKIISAITLFIVLIFVLIALVLKVFILGPLEIGGFNFFKLNSCDTAELNALILPFKKKHYWKMVGIMFLRNLYILLWTCLLIVPGIIKAYEYRMLPFILSDCPAISRKEAFRISKKMMKGNKWKAFVLDLSFFGWQILSAITCGIAGLLYVNPYIYASNAELYVVLRNEYFTNKANRG